MLFITTWWQGETRKSAVHQPHHWPRPDRSVWLMLSSPLVLYLPAPCVPTRNSPDPCCHYNMLYVQWASLTSFTWYYRTYSVGRTKYSWRGRFVTVCLVWELLYVPCTSWLSSVNNRSYKYNQMKSNGSFKWICYFKDSKHFIQSVLSHDEIIKLASNAPGSQMVRNVWLEVN